MEKILSLNKDQIKTLFFGLISKSTGLILFFVVNNFLQPENLADFFFNFSTYIFLQSIIYVQFLNFVVQEKSYSISLRDYCFLIIAPILYLIIGIFTSKFDFYCLVLLIINGLNFIIDINLFKQKGYNKFILSTAFKNIIPILIIPFIDANIFKLMLIGELIKTLIFNKYFIKDKIYTSELGLPKNTFLSYFFISLSLGLPVYLDKFFLSLYSDEALINFERIIKIPEILQTSITAGLLPIVLHQLNKKKSKMAFITINRYIALILILLILLFFPLYPFINLIFKIPENISDKHIFLISILIFISYTNLTLLRKVFSFEVNSLIKSTTPLLIILISKVFFIYIFWAFDLSIISYFFLLSTHLFFEILTLGYVTYRGN